jgi:hypothetical protein
MLKSTTEVHIYSVDGSHYALSGMYTKGFQPESVNNEIFEILRQYGKRVLDYHPATVSVLQHNENHTQRFQRLDALGDKKFERVNHLEKRVAKLLQAK